MFTKQSTFFFPPLIASLIYLQKLVLVQSTIAHNGHILLMLKMGRDQCVPLIEKHVLLEYPNFLKAHQTFLQCFDNIHKHVDRVT